MIDVSGPGARVLGPFLFHPTADYGAMRNRIRLRAKPPLITQFQTALVCINDEAKVWLDVQDPKEPNSLLEKCCLGLLNVRKWGDGCQATTRQFYVWRILGRPAAGA